MTDVTCRLTAKNRDQLRNPTLGNRVWASFTFLYREINAVSPLPWRRCCRNLTVTSSRDSDCSASTVDRPAFWNIYQQLDNRLLRKVSFGWIKHTSTKFIKNALTFYIENPKSRITLHNCFDLRWLFVLVLHKTSFCLRLCIMIFFCYFSIVCAFSWLMYCCYLCHFWQSYFFMCLLAW